jgi:hypothetical protein
MWRKAPFQKRPFKPRSFEEVAVASVQFVAYGVRRNWSVHGLDEIVAWMDLFWDFWCTSYDVTDSNKLHGVCRKLYDSGDITDWDDNVKFGYLSDAVRREAQVVLSCSPQQVGELSC